MRGEWHLNKIEKVIYTAMIKQCIYKLENDIVCEIDLTHTTLNPNQVGEVLEDLGYYQDYFETNGWEQDCWISFAKDGHPTLIIYSCGMTFDLILRKEDED